MPQTQPWHPAVLSARREHRALWQLKQMIGTFPEFPDAPLDRTTSLLDDMERRFRVGGHSPHAVCQYRSVVAQHLGDLEAAQHWYDLMLAAGRDTLSDCSACVASFQVRHLFVARRFAEAIGIGERFTNGGCPEQPQRILADLLLPYLDTGRFDEAVRAHRDGYRLVRDDPHHLEAIGQHLVFCALTGNGTRGLDLVERHLCWLDRPWSPYAAMEFASTATAVLGWLCDTGQGDLAVRRRTGDPTPHQWSTVTRVHDELARHSRDLAARFDARNGNSYQSGRVEQRMRVRPLVQRLPLTVLAGRGIRAGETGPSAPVASLVRRAAELASAGDRAGAARARLDVALALRDAGRWEDAIEAAQEAVRALDAAGLAEDALRCRHLLWQLCRRAHHYHADALAVLDEICLVDDPGGATGAGPARTGTARPGAVPPAEVLLEEAADLLHGAQAIPRLLAAADRHRAKGAPAAELRCLRKALVVLRSSPPGELDATVLARADALAGAANGGGEQLGRLDAAAARLLAARGRLADATVRAERAIERFGSGSPTGPRTIAQLLRAWLLLRVGRAVDAEEQARLVLAATPARRDWPAAVVLAKALREQGRDGEAERLMAEHEIEPYDLEHDDPDDWSLDLPD